MRLLIPLFLWIPLVFNYQVSSQSRGNQTLHSTPKFIMLAPARLRLGTKLNILLEAHSLSEPITVKVIVYTFEKESVLMRDSAILNSDNRYSDLKTIEINPNLLKKKSKNSVRLVVEFGSFHTAEKIITVSFRSGYIFIQTDKPVYNPGDTVHYRAFVSNHEFQAFNRNISLEIKNPDGIVVHISSNASASNGILSESYPLPTVHKEGKWKVVAKFDGVEENTFSAGFHVKKYDPPAFSVTLTPKKPYFSLHEEKLEVEVRARYLNGEQVRGVAYVLFGIDMNGQKRGITSLKQLNDLNGGKVSLTMAEMKNASSLLGYSVYVKASVMTGSGSDLVEAEKSGIKIVMSPYVLSIRDTPKYFKPGLPLGIVVTVSNQDGSPAPNIPVKLNFLQKPIQTHRGTIRVSINMPDEDKNQMLKVETALPGLNAANQAVQEMTLEPYLGFDGYSKNYLHISVGDNQVVVVGNSLNIKLYIKTASPEHRKLVKQLTYVVMNKGKIITASRVDVCQTDTNIPLLVTTEMLPSFRLVAYYVLPWRLHAGVVADSVFVDVENQCVGSLSLGPVDGEKLNSYSPGRRFKFQVKGDPGAKVSLVAVDNAIFLLSKNRLTQRKVWEAVGQGDMGCTAGGGRDSMGVFSDAGLAFYSSTRPSTYSGPDKNRSTKLEQREKLEEGYSDESLRRCCVDGMREIPMHYSCLHRSLYITEDWCCMLAFLRCCVEYRGEERDVVTGLLEEDRINSCRMARLASFERQDMEEEDDLADVHTKFFESWLWTDIRLPGVAQSDGLAVFPVETVLPDSITQWGILAISASPEAGFCVAEPYNVRAWRPFVLDLLVPHSVSRNEHVQIKAVVHNYMDENLKVMVILSKTEGMCSVAFNRPHRQQVSVPASSSKLITYTIIPLKTGELPLQVTVIAHCSIELDRVRKNLRVVVTGIQRIESRIFVLDPSGKNDNGDLRNGSQVIKVKKTELKSVVPNSKPETFINVRGDLLLDCLNKSMYEDSLASLIKMPDGCVEQNLAEMALPLIAVHYLDRSANWDALGLNRRDEAITYIQKGYEKQLNYRKRDDSYPPYEKEGSSTWITAFVLKVFSMAHSFISVSERHLCGPLQYLLWYKQRPDGSFQEDNEVYTITMKGGLWGFESSETLTAFVLIALAETPNSVCCQESAANIESRSRKAAMYLRGRFPDLKRPYSAAIVCYALALSNHSCTKSMLLNFASQNRTHWPDSDNHYFTLEATGYALLALIKGGHMKEAMAPFRWLNEHRDFGGGYGSTQSTVIVLQALSEYLVKWPPPSNILKVELRVPGRKSIQWTFLPKMAHKLQTAKVPFDKELTVVATGNGKGILEVVKVYHQLPDSCKNSLCNSFQLNVSIVKTENHRPDVENSYKLTIRVRSLEERANMVILDIGLPTSFEPDNSDLEQLMNSVDQYINNFEVVDNLSDRRSLIIHLFKVSSTEADVISFRLHQKFKVGFLQPSTVTVYHFYNKDKHCSRFYSPPEDQQLCRGNVCHCSQGDCCVQKPQNMSFTKERVACNGRHYAYKVKLMSVRKCYYDQYEMKIVQIIQNGSEADLKKNDRRMFLSHASCRPGLALKEGQEYLITGPITDVWHTESTSNRYMYVLHKHTWVERWPSEAECKRKSALKVKCAELKRFAAGVTNRGCQRRPTNVIL
ncbi:LOW QUALITY PROTEIN: complement C3-like [Megalobrama amblycephala]|uniref:LOW QUALITY PROTEIN: complement C3-like n=1 Tax=Megalobrama amblycephala TaxID=75352 RepID=UPI0020143EE8|nr:LOW QUALITY PROTEIN: complement C3-like [Megalobrama amblycephala]